MSYYKSLTDVTGPKSGILVKGEIIQLSFSDSIITYFWPIAKLERLTFLLSFCENANDLVEMRSKHRHITTTFGE